MNLTISPEIAGDPDLEERVRRASDLLEEQLGPSSRQVRAAWAKSADDRGRAVLSLTLSDVGGTVGYPFNPDELLHEAHLRLRFRRLWGDFLQVRSHTQLDSPLFDPVEA